MDLLKAHRGEKKYFNYTGGRGEVFWKHKNGKFEQRVCGKILEGEVLIRSQELAQKGG